MPTRPSKRRRPRTSAVDEEDSGSHSDHQDDSNLTRDNDIDFDDNTSKKLDEHTEHIIIGDIVKLALACETSRTVVKKSVIYSDIIAKRAVGMRNQDVYRAIFPKLQQFLIDKFGMQLVSAPDAYVPHRMKTVTIKSSGQSKTTVDTEGSGTLPAPLKADALMLSSILPEVYKKAVPPPRATYDNVHLGSVFVVIALIVLHGGMIKHNKLVTDLLPKAGINDTLVDTPENVDTLLTRMRETRYLLSRKVVERSGEEPKLYLCLGPRAQKEFTKDGLGAMFQVLFKDKFDPASYAQAFDKQGDLKMHWMADFVLDEESEPETAAEETGEIS